MKITLNNNEETFDDDKLTVSEIILKKNYTFKMLVTKLNGKLIKKDERENTIVTDSDDLIVLHLISGG